MLIDYIDAELPIKRLQDFRESDPVKYSKILSILNNNDFAEMLQAGILKNIFDYLISLDSGKLDYLSKVLQNKRASELLRNSLLPFNSFTQDCTPLIIDLINRDECYHLIKSGLIYFNILQKNVVSSMPNSDMKYAYPYAPEKFAKFEELLVCEREFNLISNLYNYVTMPVADNLFELSPEQIIKLTETIQSI